MSYTQQYLGYLSTPVLWKENNDWGLRQFVMPTTTDTAININIELNLRLGKRVERFVSFELRRHKNIEILTENIQIQKDKITLGEIDCLLKQDGTPIHLEIVYKFYLYDPSVGATEYDHWIGPNRKDSLVDKLTKLKDKQLPLLYRPETATFLKTTLDLEPANLQQQVYFKAQLFIPYNSETVRFNTLNPDCVKGFYIHYNALLQFQDCKFYMPAKTDWLCEVKTQTPWLNFVAFVDKLQPLIDNKTAPLCWMKSPKGLLSKCFVVWWT
ncbi:DUF1853 family protein [Formosa sp. 3Alg 14/1]|uniref:DUF1853 family protein n=1 Tax=Formosa sp. 3Alg 14/1 TaxID=3382190 RepID=UPI0039BDBFBF